MAQKREIKCVVGNSDCKDMAQQREIKCVMDNWTVRIWHNRGKLIVL
jgi:hypothetical protein